eukprot:gb/GEZN01026886.1/.p1 GENE.gb/GEZN01026886.1/~~gb/GEZN01026886.1/.p1  ORF type:complete len:131 (-),score=11.68 gb/GEZN01026886.1/:99-491(-)
MGEKVERAKSKCHRMREDLLECRLKATPGWEPGDCLPQDYNNACETHDMALRQCYSLALCGKVARKLYERPRTISRDEVREYNTKVVRCLGKYYNQLFDLSDIYHDRYSFVDPAKKSNLPGMGHADLNQN